MKHQHIILLIGLAVLLAACAGAPQDVDYPIPIINPHPTPTLALRASGVPGPLSVTINITDDPRGHGDWSGWTICEEYAHRILEPNCTLYRIPNTVPQQWVGMCRMTIQEVFALPWHDSDIVAVVEDLEGFIQVYQSPVVTTKK